MLQIVAVIMVELSNLYIQNKNILNLGKSYVLHVEISYFDNYQTSNSTTISS